jgi:hypothetical protein
MRMILRPFAIFLIVSRIFGNCLTQDKRLQGLFFQKKKRKQNNVDNFKQTLSLEFDWQHLQTMLMHEFQCLDDIH